MNKNILLLLVFRLVYWALWLSFILALIKWTNNFNCLWLLFLAYFTTPIINYKDDENNKDDSDIVDID